MKDSLPLSTVIDYQINFQGEDNIETRQYWVIDNSGYIGGPFETEEQAWQEVRECRDDPDFTSAGNMRIVKVIAECDNFYHGGIK